MPIKQKQWCVYLLVCSDQTLYCGATNDLEKRLKTHNAGTGSRYTRVRLPVKLYNSFECKNKSEALRLEYRIKQMSKKEKLEMKTTLKNEPLSLDFMNSRKTMIKLLKDSNEKIETRVDYIVKTIFKTFDQKFDNWYFAGAEEGDTGSLERSSWSKDHFTVEMFKKPTKSNRYDEFIYEEFIISNKKGHTHDLCDDGIPLRWLTEPFEEELKQGKIRYEEDNRKAEEAFKQKNEASKSQKQKALESAKAKLTKNEMKVLGIK